MSEAAVNSSVFSAGAARSAAGAAALLRLPWRRNAWRGPSGEWSGVGLGNSVDFQDHRPYSPGDDLRYVNWAAFARRFKAEMNQPEAGHALNLLAALSQTSDFSLGCYCENEDRCHRSLLRQLLADRGARIV